MFSGRPAETYFSFTDFENKANLLVWLHLRAIRPFAGDAFG
jgi:hypothetical protein